MIDNNLKKINMKMQSLHYNKSYPAKIGYLKPMVNLPL